MGITKQTSDALARRLAAIPELVKARVKPAINAGVAEIADDARALAEASRRTGDLIESIEETPAGGTTPAYGTGGSRQLDELQGAVTAGNPDQRHGHLVEFGTAPHVLGGIFEGAQHPGTEAKPFLIPALRLNRDRVNRRINRAIGKAIREAQQ